MPHYASPINVGTDKISSLGDGYTLSVSWFQAYPDYPTNRIAYHIYYSTVKENVFTDGVKYVSIDGSLQANLVDLTPSQDYWVGVRPIEYDPNVFDLSLLPVAYDNLRFYPSSMLRSNIGPTDTIIPLVDVEGFPGMGVIKVGIELMLYLAVDPINKNLIVPAGSGAAPPYLVDQGGGQFYTPVAGNVGQGTINSLSLVGNDVTETWTVRCVFVQTDGYGNPIANTAKFTATGSVSGVKLDPYGNVPTWIANGTPNNNGVLSFSITETSPIFHVGDSFIIKVNGSVPGTTGGRGYNNTPVTLHTVDGYDGYNYWSPIISLFTLGEVNTWDRVFVCQCRFEYPNFPMTVVDGYHQVTQDFLSTDLSAADAANVDFPMYDYAGYHRTDPVQLLNGTCVGSYIGGEMGCIDGYGNYNIYRGFSLQDQNTQRQEIKLSIDGQPAVLIRRVQTGITCACYLQSSEYPDDRCPFCYGTKFVFGYEQYFNPRRSDGRIMVRVSPTDESLKMTEAGLESEFPLSMWTLTVPTIKMRDIIVLFDQANNESFRYEVGAVTRNSTILGLDGGQQLKTMRIRKTDPAYQIRIFRDSSDFPSKLNTTLGMTTGIPPHTHEIVINEKVTSVSQINQTTAVSQGHNHPIVNGQVIEVLGHTHQIILP